MMENSIIVEVEQGLLRGKQCVNYENGTFYSFHGIPYALPPVGNLRFRAPQLPKKWDGTRDATQEGNACLSLDTITRKLEGSEDCLFLNVYTPELPSNRDKASKPVMVYIHGGAYHSGSSKTELYGPDFLLTQDIVLVTLNYRLGILGFLCLEDTSLGVTGNNGLRDIIMALKWVQANIKSFLGDPNNVSLFGESSGAICVHYCMFSPLSRGLFHKVILQSGCALNHWREGARDSAKQLVKAMGMAFETDKEILEFLLKQPAEELHKGQEMIKVPVAPSIKRHFYPVIEKVSQIEPPVIARDPFELIKTGDYYKVPMMMGYTGMEGMFCEHKIRQLTKHDKNNVIIPDFEEFVPHYLYIPKGSPRSKYIANEIQSYYFNGEEPTLKHLKQFYEVQGDIHFNHYVMKAALLHNRNLGYPVYFFRFSVDGELNIYKRLQGAKFPGASHSDDVCYLFKMSLAKEIVKNSLEDVTIRRMVTLWTNFARYSDPNVRKHDELIPITWKPIEDDRMHFLDIGIDLCVGVNPERAKFLFWDRLYNTHPIIGKL